MIIAVVAMFAAACVSNTIGRSLSMWLRALVAGLVAGGTVLVAGIIYERHNKRKSGRL
ncbi:MAG: hypothetical protein NTZ09_11415 [Candidatus Hydrogenedentes bacterium]|nr:hypothetical protein [Candidatus Hydrogenedentota bacterium]